MTATTSHPEHASGRTPRRAALASFMGSAVEYYDFFLFGSAAALIFPRVFFPSDNKAALVMSFATFGFAYIARPVGAVILGHFGDRIGRQRVLMFTLVLMGMSTFIIGCLPTFETIGWAAPALLVVCRLMQGFSAAGEQAGASSLTLEHSPDNQRAFFTSWTLTGTQGGLILASLILIPFMALPDEAKYSWGWRVPFWFSAVVVVVAFFIRRQLHETPQFTEARKPARSPRCRWSGCSAITGVTWCASSCARSSLLCQRFSRTLPSPTAKRWDSTPTSPCGWWSRPRSSRCWPSWP